MTKNSSGSIDFTLPLKGGGSVTINVDAPLSEEDGTFVRGLIYGAVAHLSAIPRQVEVPEPAKKPRAAYNKGKKMEKVPCDYCGGKYARGTGMAAHLRACPQHIKPIGPNAITTVWNAA